MKSRRFVAHSCTEFQRSRLESMVGDIADEERVPVRVHSECLLGDVFSSRRCQCGDQLKAFMKLLSKSRRGAILYLQAGRSIVETL